MKPKTKEDSFAPPPGYVAFRPVIIKCTECGGTTTTNGQMQVGVYEWECDLCRQKTKHAVSEAT